MTPKLFKDLENFIKTKYGSLLGKQLIDEELITGSISVKRQENYLKSQRRTMIEIWETIFGEKDNTGRYSRVQMLLPRYGRTLGKPS